VSMMDDEIQTCKTRSEYIQSHQVAIPVPFASFHSKSFGLTFSRVHSHWKTTADLFNAQHSIQFAHTKQSFLSARKLFSTICSFQYGSSSSMVQSLAVKVQVSSTLTFSCHAFTLFAFEPITSTTKVSRHAFTLLAFEPITSTTKVSCHAFALLAFELVTSITNISSAKTALKATAGMQPSANSNNIHNASSFDDKHSFTFQLVVASVNWKLKAVSNKLFRTLRLGRIKSKMPFIFQLIVGSKQVHQRILQQVLVDVWSSNAISYFGPNQHKSSCAYLLAVHSKCPN
jgi:hypothetical protein